MRRWRKRILHSGIPRYHRWVNNKAQSKNKNSRDGKGEKKTLSTNAYFDPIRQNVRKGKFQRDREKYLHHLDRI